MSALCPLSKPSSAFANALYFILFAALMLVITIFSLELRRVKTR